MPLPSGRLSGILLPLFSLRSRDDVGIGDFGCFEGLFDWMRAAQQQWLMLLPLLPTAPNDPSPYATRSGFGFNPLYIDLSALPGALELTATEKDSLQAARAAPSVQYDRVFPLKAAALERAHRHAQVHGSWVGFERFCETQRDWLENFTLFTTLSEVFEQRPWWDWPEGLKTREPAALEKARFDNSDRIRFHAWLQWVADEQWKKVRASARAHGILLCGDEPFIIGKDSADAWAFPHLLRGDGRLGVPPDDFSADGQDWGLPWFDFNALEKEGYRWLKRRSEWAGQTYDLRRVDHAIGYFRQFVRNDEFPKGHFIPGDEPSQQPLGEKHFRLLSEGSGIIAEDLGVIPPFAKETLAELKLPGYRVMRWARRDGVYENPAEYPAVSLATTGTHDTETLREWWETAQPWEREAMCRSFAGMQPFAQQASWSSELHLALLRAAENSASQLCVIPWNDVFAETSRVNFPGTMGPHNWSYRIRPLVEELGKDPEAVEKARTLAELTQSGRRSTP